jgi:tRNA-dihydrouridine synthase B
MIEIGPFLLPGKAMLAPMAGITDRPFRSLCMRHGAVHGASEMISSDTLLHATAKTSHRIVRASGSRVHAVQIAGSDPQQMAEAALLNVAHGAEIIDINMGCPAKKVCNRAAGSALLSEPPLVERILAAVVAAVDVPVTLKIRTGPDRATRNGVDIARIAERAGVACLAVHGRTRADRFAGDAEYDTIAAIVDAVTIPVIANGDIRCGADASEVLATTGAAGVMIGRAAQGNPFIFAEINAVLSGADVPPPPGIEQVHEALVEQVSGCHDLYGEYRGLRIARKHIAWYCRGLRHATRFREAINQVTEAPAQLAMVDRFFERPATFAEVA